LATTTPSRCFTRASMTPEMEKQYRETLGVPHVLIYKD
jgi:hypothetical protein